MGLISTSRAVLARWYVAAVLVTALGIVGGSLFFFKVFPGRPQVGVIDVPLVVIGDDTAFVIGEMIDYARRTDSIKAVVVNLTTPGGGVAQSEELYRKMVRLREEKPVVVASGWLNTSGGMMMSMGANYIYAEHGSFVGSIGVILGLQEPEPPNELLISTGPSKLTGASQRTFIGMMELLKQSFIQTVIKERGERLHIGADELAEARIYLGLEAQRLGLVDATGTPTDAIEKAASLAGISGYELVDINEKVFREFILKLRRTLASSDGPEPEFQMSDIHTLRRIASASEETEGELGVPLNFPIDVNLPRMYYLYVVPTE